MPKLGIANTLQIHSGGGGTPITTSRAFDSSGAQVGSAITGNILSPWVGSSNVASVIFANNGSLIQIGSSTLQINSLTSVTIPNSVTIIGASAFFTNNLTSVTLGTSLASIGSSAFRNNQLTSITIPINVTTINGSAFRDNINLASVNCYTTHGAFVFTNAFTNTAPALTIHVREADNTWTIGSQSFQGNPNVTVIKDLNPSLCSDATAQVLMAGGNAVWPHGPRTLTPIGYAPYGFETYQYGDEVVRYDGSAWIYENNGGIGEIARVYSAQARPWLATWPAFTGTKVCP